jgi:uncharacterized protein (TIGR03437 family)
MLLAATAAASAQTCDLPETPRVATITNAASNLTGVASLNSLITIWGSNFQRPGQSRSAGALDLAGGTYPTELGCVAVDIDGVRAPLIYIDATQINAQVPAFAPPREAWARVIANQGTANGRVSDRFPLQIRDQSPAFFLLVPTPCIAAVFPDGQIAGDPSLLPFTRGPRVGEVIWLYATGLGLTEPVWQAGEIPGEAAPALQRIQIEFDGRPISADHILYAGLTPGAISGLYQINLRIPEGFTANAHHTVRVRVGETLSQGPGTLYIAPEP